MTKKVEYKLRIPIKLDRVPYGYWDYDTCEAEAKKYKNRTEFSRGAGTAYKLSVKKKWINKFFPK